MSRRGRKHAAPKRCRDCGLQADPLQIGPYPEIISGRCPACRAEHAAALRRETNLRLLAKATPAGTETRGDKTFTIIQLPAKTRWR